jgi:chromosomal replication initiation ATPase DnaA
MSNNYNKVKQIVAKAFGISVDDISTKSRKRKYVNARCAFAHVLFDNNILRNASEIGRLIDRDHSTVLNALNNHDDYYMTDHYYQNKYKEILKIVGKVILNYEDFDLMKLFKRIEINKRCEPCLIEN